MALTTESWCVERSVAVIRQLLVFVALAGCLAVIAPAEAPRAADRAQPVRCRYCC